MRFPKSGSPSMPYLALAECERHLAAITQVAPEKVSSSQCILVILALTSRRGWTRPGSCARPFPTVPAGASSSVSEPFLIGRRRLRGDAVPFR